ncbi:hypothetical protein ADU37_CDS02820 [Thermococcus sp. 2319x1]|nr:hypothetical protein ADU37_CDS02820 [Thermococcus sp. 2319x1]
MDVKKVLLGLFLAGVLGVAVVASGCIGGQQTSTPTTVTQKETVTETKPVEQITLKVIGPWSGQSLMPLWRLLRLLKLNIQT